MKENIGGRLKKRNRRFHKGASLTVMPMSRIMPNIITLISLCVGFSSVRFALTGKWQVAVACIIGAAILDGTDGRVARMLNSASQFGAELDSLADFVAFGASPALVMYLFSIRSIGAYSWAICLFYVVCSVLRLARFNIQSIGGIAQHWEKKFFTGVPIPLAAIITVTPVMLSMEYECKLFSSANFCATLMLLSGALMISRIKTFSFKTVKIPQKMMLPVMLGTGFVVTLLVTALWSTMVFIVISYLLMIPVSACYYKKLAASFADSIPPNKEPEEAIDFSAEA